MIEQIVTDVPAAPDVPLSHAVRAGDRVLVAGRIAARPDGSLVIGAFAAEVRAVLDNLRGAVEAATSIPVGR